MKRLIDIFLAGFLLLMLLLPCLLLSVIVWATSHGPAIHWSDRMGRDNQVFRMPKFRTMYIDTPLVATDELDNPRKHITKMGLFMRKSSLDELPQLLMVLTGKMSLVGPRPVLVSQEGLLKKRSIAGIDSLRPGITGWAQINGRDNLTEDEKVQLDAEYKSRQSLWFDFQIMWRTVFYVLKSNGVWH